MSDGFPALTFKREEWRMVARAEMRRGAKALQDSVASGHKRRLDAEERDVPPKDRGFGV